jgi:carbonic anhydrase
LTKRLTLFGIVVVLNVMAFLLYFAIRWRLQTDREIRQVSPSSTEAIAILMEGNLRFMNERRRFPRFDKMRITETALSQEPFATFLACSDSRVPVENIFDVGIGDLFVVRIAGNVCSDHEIGSIEYGVEHLKTPLVVVMGHTHCGAVTAVVEDMEVRGKFSHLAEHIIPSYEEALALHPKADRQTILTEAVRCNVRKAISDLVRMSEGVRKKVEAGKVKIVGAIYNLNTGTVEWLPDLLSKN